MPSLREILSDALLGRSFACQCGATHTVPTRRVTIELGVAERVPELLCDLVPGQRALVVADPRTWKVAGDRLERALSRQAAVDACVLEDSPSGQIHASVELVDMLDSEHPGPYDLFAAVGSGTVNDLVKALAQRRQGPYVVLATAASMNGYTSAIVALLEDGLKTTAPATPPLAVFADPEVLCGAPLELTLAGLGDLVSKPFCSCDWRIAALITGEPWCPTPGEMLAEAFDSALDVLPAIARRDAEAVALLFALLLVSGLSMTVAGTSSPASGGEHLLSHYWDMVHLRDGHALGLHGAQVGVASLAMHALYERILATDFAAAPFLPSPSAAEAEAEIREVFGSLADSVWPQWRAKLEHRSSRILELLREHEVEIKAEIEDVLAAGHRVRQALESTGAPTRAADLGIPPAELEAAIRHGRTIRTRFTVLDVAAELGVLDDFARDYAREEIA